MEQNSFLRRALSRAGRLAAMKPAHLSPRGGIVSFSFDDAPVSALTVGGPILAKHGCAATYYLSGHLTDGYENNLPCHSRADIRAMLRDGHELASHAFEHKDMTTLGREEILRLLDANDDFLAEFGAPAGGSFAYPFGAVDRRSKRLVSQRFATARGVHEGVNAGLIDMAELKAVHLYNATKTEGDVTRRIEQAASSSGWLIFLTHDVSDDPSPFGCSPAILDHAVRTALALGCAVMPVGKAASLARPLDPPSFTPGAAAPAPCPPPRASA